MVTVPQGIQNPAYSPLSAHLLYPLDHWSQAAGCGLLASRNPNWSKWWPWTRRLRCTVGQAAIFCVPSDDPPGMPVEPHSAPRLAANARYPNASKIWSSSTLSESHDKWLGTGPSGCPQPSAPTGPAQLSGTSTTPFKPRNSSLIWHSCRDRAAAAEP